MTAPRQVVVLNLGLDEAGGDAWQALVHEAARLAANAGDGGGALHLATLGEPDAPPALARAATWWRFTHDEIDATRPASQDALVQLGGEMLQHEGLPTQGPVLVLLPAGAEGEAIAARLAARCGGVALGRCLTLRVDADGVHATRASHGGKVQLSLRSRARLCFATWRAAADDAARPVADAHVPTLRSIRLASPLPAGDAPQILPSADARTPLAGARIVVSGGRGMQGDEGFALLARTARVLGAALGGSLPAVDAGWLPVARQIGQSGRFVSPRVYLAVGISGTLQHLAGVSTGSTIVAVNNDPAAPIFGVAEVGVLADWHELLPALLARLERPA